MMTPYKRVLTALVEVCKILKYPKDVEKSESH